MEYNLRGKRRKMAKTQKQIADYAHISLKSYQRIENGMQRPSVDTALLIARALGTTVEDIFVTK